MFLLAALNAQQTAQPAGAPGSGATGAGEEVVELSPFEVVSSSYGYYGANTTSGTRISSKIEDLASSITVVTKQQMEDFAMLDIHDVFSYEAGTEGLGQFTNFEVNQDGAVTDASIQSPNNSNRVRGIGPANMLFGNFEVSGIIPFDPILIDGVEISRGPNSSIFGIGNTAGSVNSIPASASLFKNSARASVRVDTNDGYRMSLDVNQVLARGKLAVRGSIVYQKTGYNLKPSGMDTRLYNAMVKYRPFRNTTLSAMFSSYRSKGTRANYLTPSDGVSDWIANGRPAYDPLTKKVTVNGQAAAANLVTGAKGNLQFYADHGVMEYFAFRAARDLVNPINLVGSFAYSESRYLEDAIYNGQTLFKSHMGVSDRSIYDWKSVNLASANYYDIEGKTAMVLLDHVFVSNSRHQLAMQLGWFHEETESNSLVVIGVPRSDASSTRLMVDLNSRRLDGTPNPYFGRPYLSAFPYEEWEPTNRDIFRAQAAYRLDFRHEKSWLRWLGMHNFTAYGEYKHFTDRRARWRHHIVSDVSWIPTGASRGGNANTGIGGRPGINNNISAPFVNIYVGDAVGGNVDYGPQYYPMGKYTLEWGNTNGTKWTSLPVAVGRVVSIGTGQSSNTETINKTIGAIWQGHFLKDRLITTAGWRYDESNDTIGGDLVSEDGITFDYDTFYAWKPGWTKGSGHTTTLGAVIKPFPWLGIYANKSDSFRPTTPRQDLYFNRMSNPKGEGEDYGVMVNLFKGKLWMKLNRYSTRQLQTPNGVSSTYVNRIKRLDFDIFDANLAPQQADTFNLQRHATEWVQLAALAQGVTLTKAEQDTRVAAIMQVPVAYLQEPAWTNGAADDILSKGYEFELNYNPVKAWTIKLNATQQEVINERVAPELQEWVNARLPVWQSIVDPTTGRLWYTEIYDAGRFSAKSFLEANVFPQIKEARVTEGLSRPQIRKYRVNLSTNFRLSGITSNRILRGFNIGGSVRWEDKGAIGYYGVQQPPALVTDYDHTRPIWDKDHTYVDLLLGYRTRLFSGKIPATFQLNVRNVFEDGRLQPVAAYPDGVPYAYRIIEPRVIILTATFDF